MKGKADGGEDEERGWGRRRGGESSPGGVLSGNRIFSFVDYLTSRFNPCATGFALPKGDFARA